MALTGAASAVGRAVRTRLEGDGIRVIGIDLHDSDITADLGTPQGRVAAMNEVLERADRILDGLVLCAGLGPDEAPPARQVSVNYYGAVAMLDGLRPVLSAGTDPAAVAVVPHTIGLSPSADNGLVDGLADLAESVACRAAESYEAREAQVMSRMALVRAVRIRSLDWGRSGVRLNVLARGPVSEAPMVRGTGDPAELPVPLDRATTTEDLAGVVAFLLGRDAAMVHGAVLFADGGTDALLRPELF